MNETEQTTTVHLPATKGEIAIVVLLVLIFAAVLAGAKDIATAIRGAGKDRR